jgi:PPM family protein phosphatase
MHEARIGDRYLFCSDGLCGVVRFETLQDTMAAGQDPADTCELWCSWRCVAADPTTSPTCIIAGVVDASSITTDTVPIVTGATSTPKHLARPGLARRARMTAEVTTTDPPTTAGRDEPAKTVPTPAA